MLATLNTYTTQCLSLLFFRIRRLCKTIRTVELDLTVFGHRNSHPLPPVTRHNPRHLLSSIVYVRQRPSAVPVTCAFILFRPVPRSIPAGKRTKLIFLRRYEQIITKNRTRHTRLYTERTISMNYVDRNGWKTRYTHMHDYTRTELELS